jgi:hypothetical protein
VILGQKIYKVIFILENMKNIIFKDSDYSPLKEFVSAGAACIMDAQVLYMLLDSIDGTYHPETNTLAMAVGIGGMSKEGSIIRGFHEKRFKENKIFVVGCEKSPKKGIINSGNYDLELRGEQEGDARYHESWFRGIKDKKISYDFILMNHPSLPLTNDWISIYKKAIFFLSPKGVIATVSSGEQDRQMLEEICDIIIKYERDIQCNLRYYQKMPDSLYNTHTTAIMQHYDNINAR